MSEIPCLVWRTAMNPRLAGLFVLLAAGPLAAGGAPGDTKAIGPEEAARKVNETVTVRMEVKSVGSSKSVYFLNSKEDYKDEKNFTIFLPAETVKKFKEAKVDDLVKHFKGKTVEVTGKVILYREKPEIKVEELKQIKIVEKK
jgi:DNA/RNA endonuclease YhcR with UshA esterase domain